MSQEKVLEADQEGSSTDGVGATLVVILLCHVVVDALAALMPSSLGLVEARFSLTTEQAAWLLGLGSLTSGLAQPICAVFSDRLATRHLGSLGVGLAALGIGAICLADGLVALAITYACGMIGVGMFHPVAASTIGQLRSDRRNAAVSLFFVAGMTGGALGALTWPRILSSQSGFHILPWTVAPVLVMALLLQRNYTQLTPLRKHHERHLHRTSARTPWGGIFVLYVAASLKFCVNLALLYLYVRWVQRSFGLSNPEWSAEAIAAASAPFIGNLNACTLTGMAAGGISAGVLVRSGREKFPLIVIPILFAPLVALFPWASLKGGYLLAFAAGVGFASMVPVTIALAQQMLPHRPNLASSLMMGGAWAVAMLGPRFAELGVTHWGINNTFYLTAGALAISGIVCIAIRSPREV